jgi:hypothetical protein
MDQELENLVRELVDNSREDSPPEREVVERTL